MAPITGKKTGPTLRSKEESTMEKYVAGAEASKKREFEERVILMMEEMKREIQEIRVEIGEDRKAREEERRREKKEWNKEKKMLEKRITGLE